MGKAVQTLGLAQYELSSHSSEMSWDWEKWMETALMVLFRLALLPSLQVTAFGVRLLATSQCLI